MERRILLTGGTGLIGSELLHRYLEWDPDVHVVVAVRAPSEEHARHRVRHLVAGFQREPERVAAALQRVTPLRADLARSDLGLAAGALTRLRAEIDTVVHAAAAVRMDLPLATLRQQNVEATRSLLDSFQGAPRLERFHHASTIGVAGDLGGVVREAPLRPSAFNNDYERSKWEAEALVLERRGEVPVSIHRLSQIFGDSVTGWTPHFRMSYLFARLMVSGVLPFLPVAEHATADAITSDFAADALFVLTRSPAPASGVITQLVAGAEARPIRAWMHAVAARAEPLLAAHGLPVPVVRFVSVAEFTAWRAAQPTGTATAALLAQIDGLLPHVTLPARTFDDTHTLAALAGSGVTKRVPFDSAVIDAYAIRSQWGMRPEPRPPLRPRAPGAAGASPRHQPAPAA